MHNCLRGAEEVGDAGRNVVREKRDLEIRVMEDLRPVSFRNCFPVLVDVQSTLNTVKVCARIRAYV